MNTEKTIIFSADGIDLSEFITENSLRVKYTPVYDESAEFHAMDGNIKKTRLGIRADISAEFTALPSETAERLSALAEKESYYIYFRLPDEKTAEFETLSLSIEPERAAGDETYWTAFLSARSKVIREDGL